MNTITIENMSKNIKCNTVLKNINLKLESGNIYGLVGINGSGKTMLIRSIAGLIKPTEGKIFFNDKQIYKDISCIPSLGIIIENITLYPEFTGFKNLKLLADIQKKITPTEIKESIKRVGLDPDDKRTVRKYSLGMRQKIALAQAFMEKPDVILLDEPTNSLDETSVKLIHKICKEEAQRGALIIIASHSKEDITNLCKTVYLMKDGTTIDLS